MDSPLLDTWKSFLSKHILVECPQCKEKVSEDEITTAGVCCSCDSINSLLTSEADNE